MVFLLFRAGGDGYVLAARDICEVAPLVTLRACPSAPPYVAGLFNRGGVVVPVVDLCHLLGGRRSAPRLSTRIIVVSYEGQQGRRRLLGLLAEEATRALDLDESQFAQAGIAAPGAPFLGPVCCLGNELIQRVQVEDVLPREMESLLFPEG